MLSISHIERNTELLGPYHRYVLWVYGCCFDCECCMAYNTKFGSETLISPYELADDILRYDVEGITISGGEPFMQATALYEMVARVKQKKDYGVIIYSGFTLAELKESQNCAPLLSVTDILIDGRYIKELDVGQAYIGSSNQTLHYLTDRYKNIGKEYYSAQKRRAEIKLTVDQAVLIGVPSANVLNTWHEIKKKTGGDINEF